MVWGLWYSSWFNSLFLDVIFLNKLFCLLIFFFVWASYHILMASMGFFLVLLGFFSFASRELERGTWMILSCSESRKFYELFD